MVKTKLKLGLTLLIVFAMVTALSVQGVAALGNKAFAESSYSAFWGGTYEWTGYKLWEDCDWDGYDDHTGKKVPVGFDGTKGDSPSGAGANSQVAQKNNGSDLDFSSGASGSGSSTAKSTTPKKSTSKKTTAKKTTSTKSTTTKDAAKSSTDDKTDAEKKAAEEKAAADKKAAAKKAKKNKATDADTDAAVDAPIAEAEVGTVALAPQTFISGDDDKTLILDSAAYVEGATIRVFIYSAPIDLGTYTVAKNELGELFITLALDAYIKAGAGEHNLVLQNGEALERLEVSVDETFAAAQLVDAPDPAVPTANTGIVIDNATEITAATLQQEFVGGIALLASLAILAAVALAGSKVARKAKQGDRLEAEPKAA